MNPWVRVYPDPSLADSEVDITVHGLPPGEFVTIQGTQHSGPHAFESFGVYQVASNGSIDLSQQESIAGTYHGVSKMGLLWSVEPSPKNKVPFARFMVKDVTKPNMITLKVYNKQFFSINQLLENKNENVIAEFQMTRLYMKPGTRRIVVNKPDVKGTLFIPPGKGPFPGVMYILGAMANPYETHSSLISSHGFAAFNLKYFGFENWEFHVDMKKFEIAVAYLSEHPEVKGGEGVSVVGICKGGQFCLCMAECLQGIKSVVSINSTTVPIHNSHHYHEKLWPSVDHDKLNIRKLNKIGAFVGRNELPVVTDFDNETLSKSVFKFYNCNHVQFLIISSLNDSNVPSEHYCNHAENLLKNAHHPQYCILRYAGAGHIFDPPYTPFCFQTPGTYLFKFIEWGGFKVPHCEAQIDSWKKIIQFLNHGVQPHYSKL